MKLTFMIKIIIILLIPFTIFAEQPSKGEKSSKLNEKLKIQVDQLNNQSVNYLRYDIPKAAQAAESAEIIAKRIGYKEGEADALLNFSNSISSQSSVKEVMKILQQSLNIYSKINNEDKIAKTLNRMSISYFALQNYTKSYNYATKALSIYEKRSNFLGMADSYEIIGRIYGIWDMPDNSNEAFNNSKDLYRKASFHVGIADILIYQGNLLTQKGDIRTAKIYYSNAIYLLKKSGNLTKLADSYNVMSTYYSDYEKNLDRSFYFLNKAINITERTKDSSRLSSFLTHKAHLYYLTGNFKLNLLYDLKALEIRQKLNQTLAVGSSYINIGSDYIYLKDFANAEKNLLEGFRVTQKSGIIFYARRAAHLLHGLYRMTNKPEKALIYLDSAYKLTQIINQEEKMHQNSLVEVERELRLREQKINNLEDKRSNILNLAFIIISVFGVSFSLLLLYLNWVKKSDNLKLLAKSSELERSEHKYRNLIETAPDLIYSLDSDGRFLSINPAFETLTSYSVNDFLGKEFASLVQSEDLDLAYETFNNAQEGKVQEPYVLRLLKRNGDFFYGEFISKELMEDGEIIGEFGIVRDITAKKIAKEALRASEERYRIFINSTDDMAFLKDDKYRYMIVNKLYSEYFGKPEQYILGKTDFELMSADGAELCKKSDDKALNSNSVVMNEEIVNGRIYDTHKFKVSLSDGSFGIGGYIRDITERKQAELALKTTEKQYSDLLETMSDGLMQVDNDDVIQFVNKAICNIFDYTQEELIGKIGNETIIHPDDRQILIKQNKSRLVGNSEHYEVRGIKKFGEVIWVRISGSPIIDSDGNTTGSVGLISDITERKLAEEQIQEEKHFSDFLIESLPGIFYMFDQNLKPIRWNRNKQTFLGLSYEEMANHNILDSIVADDKATLIQSIERTMTLGESQDIIRIIQHNGEVFSYHLTGKKLDTESGSFLMGVGIDISERVKIEEELIIAKEKAEESEHLKSSFLANMSHELRTPMVGILGFSQLLSDVEDLPKAKEMGSIINSSGKRLMDTLNMILDLARIEAGESELEITEMDLVESINEVILTFDAIAKTKNLILRSYSGFENYSIYSSNKIIASVLNNLVNNAIKFTNSGSIVVTLEEDIVNGKKSAIIKVADTGIGISQKDLANVFIEFRQVSEGLSRSHEGTGLGLTLCKKYIDMLGGSINVESTLGVGTVFTILIPDLDTSNSLDSIDNADEESKIINTIMDKQKDFNLRILIVDDDPTSIFLVERILGKQFFIDPVNNASDAIEKVKENKYTLILMDINLGKSKNGIYATSEIRKLEDYKNTPIIAMTAYAMAGDREEFISRGCTDYISKPFTKDELINIIFNYI